MLKQVGNAVPPHLGRALGAQIRAAVAGGAELRDFALLRDKETEELVASYKEAGSDKRNRIDEIFKQQKKLV